MLKENYRDYTLMATPLKLKNAKWKVSVIIKKEINGVMKEEEYTANDKIEYILEIEAAKESINLGKNLIKMNIVKY